MKKIISLYQRNYETDRLVRDELVPGAEWVPAGEGVATRKYDGTCCLVGNGRLFKRYEVKRGGTPPYGFIPATDEDENTGKVQGWLEVGNGNDDKWHREAVGGNPDKVDLLDGTYELVGPKIQGNPEHYEKHTLVAHAYAEVLDAPRTFDAIKDYLSDKDLEGIVWHHEDGRMVKIKAKDFGLRRGR
jgi:hypothetical protein